jgi:hypothetical protein
MMQNAVSALFRHSTVSSIANRSRLATFMHINYRPCSPYVLKFTQESSGRHEFCSVWRRTSIGFVSAILFHFRIASMFELSHSQALKPPELLT